MAKQHTNRADLNGLIARLARAWRIDQSRLAAAILSRLGCDDGYVSLAIDLGGYADDFEHIAEDLHEASR